MYDAPDSGRRIATTPHRVLIRCSMGIGLSIAVAFFIAIGLCLRLGLHNDVNPIAVLVWLAFGSAITTVVYRMRQFSGLPGFRDFAKRSGAIAVTIGWVVGAAVALGPDHDPHASDVRRQSRCAFNVRRIQMAVELYAQENQYRYPDRLQQLIDAGFLEPETLVCPSTDDSPAPATSPADLADQLANGGHNSYRYVGAGFTQRTATADDVILFESTRNHHKENPGIFVLYGDGHSDYLTGSGARDFAYDWSKRHRPPS